MTKGLKITLIAGSVVLVCVGGYLAYTYFKPKLVKKDSNNGAGGNVGNTPAPPAQTNTYVAPTTSPSASDSFPLQVGSSGDNVTSLQKYLNSRGASLIADGQFGNMTKQAVMKYITTSGVVDSGTYNAYVPSSKVDSIAQSFLSPVKDAVTTVFNLF